MVSLTKTHAELERENEDLRRRLEEADATIAAIQDDAVDAFVIRKAGGERVITLETATRVYRILVEHMQQGAVTLAADGTILYSNHRFAGLVRRPVDALPGQSMHALVHPGSRARFEALLAEAQAGGTQAKLALLGEAGAPVSVSVAANPLLDDTALVCLMITDLTDEEALREASNRKDQFLAVLGHELRNALGPIRNATQVLQFQGGADPALQQAREMIERQTTHMTRLMDDLLDVSRIARGMVLLRRQALDLVPLVRTVLDDCRIALEAGGLTPVPELPGGPVWVLGDSTRLAQVVGNLLHNAVKFTDPGGTITVRLRAEDQAAVLSVRDTGIGLAPETLPRVFDSFMQADVSRHRSRGGLGLGLALVKGLVELHGGSVAVTSDGPGQGTEFTVRLPLVRPPDPTDGPSAASTAPATRAYRILVIEDNVDAAESMQTLLRLAGHTVEVAFTGPTGLAAARILRPDVVLCDIGLPGGMDGYAVARALRQDPTLASAYRIALTGYAREEDQRLAADAGFMLHLTKPVTFAELQRALAELPSHP